MIENLYNITKYIVREKQSIKDLETIKDFLQLIPAKVLRDNGLSFEDLIVLSNLIQSEIDYLQKIEKLKEC